ncbi:MAG: SIMPL domain-containing protein, partial [Pseudomonadota bacterium]
MTAVNIVSKWGISVLLVLGLSACGEEPLETLRTIAVVGEGEVAAAPTLAKLRVNVQSLGETAEAAAGANGEKMNAIFDKLEELGVSREEDIVTNYIIIDRRWKMVPTETGERRQEPDGFAATNAITVTLRDITEVSAMFDALAGVGAA